MKVLHIAHFEVKKYLPIPFTQRITNGLERFLASLRDNFPSTIEQYFLFFHPTEKELLLHQIDIQGRYSLVAYVDWQSTVDEDVQKSLQQILDIINPDVVHVHFLQPYTQYIPKFVKKFSTNIYTIATMHDESFLAPDFGKNQKYQYNPRVKQFFQYLDDIVFLHRVSYQRYLSLYEVDMMNKSHIIPHGINLPHIAKINDKNQPFKVMFLGGFNEFKGGELVRQFLMKHQNDATIESLILGKMYLDMQDVVYQEEEYTPNNLVEKVKKYNPDIIIVPSIVEETFSYVALEATALGYPIICFSVGALMEIEKEQRGFVVQDISFEALEHKISEVRLLKENDIMWTKLFAKIKDFPIVEEQKVAQKYQQLYFSRAGNKPHNQMEVMTQAFVLNKQRIDALKQEVNQMETVRAALLREEQEHAVQKIANCQANELIQRQRQRLEELDIFIRERLLYEEKLEREIKKLRWTSPYYYVKKLGSTIKRSFLNDK